MDLVSPASTGKSSRNTETRRTIQWQKRTFKTEINRSTT